MKISSFAKERVKVIDWFNQLGTPPLQANYISVDQNNFIKSIESIEWENATLEARNEITGFLSTKHKIIFQNWNFLADEAKDFVENSIIPLIPSIDHIDMNIVLTNLKWDLVNYLIEDAYKDKLRMTLFFNNLLSIYESGHIPCGWDGQWPNGQLIVY